MFRVFQSGSLEQTALQTATGALRAVLATVNLEMLLPKLMEYSKLALDAADLDVRLLGVEQLRRLSWSSDLEISSDAIHALFKAFRVRLVGMIPLS